MAISRGSGHKKNSIGEFVEGLLKTKVYCKKSDDYKIKTIFDVIPSSKIITDALENLGIDKKIIEKINSIAHDKEEFTKSIEQKPQDSTSSMRGRSPIGWPI